jgi:hypothetical protein
MDMAKTAAKAVAKPADKSAKPKKSDAKPTKAKTAEQAQKPKPTKAKAPKSVLQQTSATISQLASDILADRIVPTIEQIKSIAASALGQDGTKGKNSKAKGK